MSRAITEHLEKINLRLSKFEQLLCMYKSLYNLEEACVYTGRSKSFIYKETAAGRLPHYKPTGRMMVFKREDLDTFLLRNRISATEMHNQSAA